MGDGHHIWAAAEWILMLRNSVVREEGDRLMIGEGFMPDWLEQNRPLKLGPVPTTFGTIAVEIQPRDDRVDVQWTAGWRREPSIEIRIPGLKPLPVAKGAGSACLVRSGALA